MAVHPNDNAGRRATHQTALLTGILVFVPLLALDALDLWPHSLLRAGLVGGASWAVSAWIVHRFQPA